MCTKTDVYYFVLYSLSFLFSSQKAAAAATTSRGRRRYTLFSVFDCAKHRYSIKLLLKVVLNFQTDSEEQALLTRR